MTKEPANPLVGDLSASWNSKYAENLFEHFFIAEVLQECAFVRKQKVAVLRGEVDDAGYDLVLRLGTVIRHIQLKASRKHGSTKSVKVNAVLQDHVGGCVVWMLWVEGKDHRCEFTYRFFGNPFDVAEARPLPDKAAKVSKDKMSKPHQRVVTPSQFNANGPTYQFDIHELVDLLFGPP
jgi:hypothetical protein